MPIDQRAMFLKDLGFTDVRLLANGWTVWQDAGFRQKKQVPPMSGKRGSAVKVGIAGHGRLWSGWIFLGCRLLLGVVFIYASYDKILPPDSFALGVYNYHILPDAAINLAALVLPWLELLLGLCCSA